MDLHIYLKGLCMSHERQPSLKAPFTKFDFVVHLPSRGEQDAVNVQALAFVLWLMGGGGVVCLSDGGYACRMRAPFTQLYV